MALPRRPGHQRLVCSEAVNDMREMTAPVSFEGPLALLGYRVVVTEDQEIELHTWWRVLETSERPFSLIGHAVDASGQAVLVADGLGIPFTELQVGDQFVQRHRFSFLEMEELPNSPVWLQTGGYWLDSMERWSVIIEGSSISDRVVLSEIDFSVTD